ncbi:MAG: glycosyltransferase [Candidatus Cloacimonetes bacterium]|nr:glycosyltransferase [Candidatus Cloacimonadota bacterium]
MQQAIFAAAGLTGLSLLVYLAYIIRFGVALRRKDEPGNNEKPFVSVVIAARNEEAALPMLLTTLVNQSYSQGMFEVIVADDDSTDNTAAVVRQFSARWPNVRLVSVTGRDKAVSPKKNALAQAVDVGSGSIILTTDADCMVGRHWIRSMVAYFEPDVAMVVGYSRTMLPDWRRATLAQKFEHFDFFAMFAAAAGAVAAGKPFSCSGQNLGYRRSAYDKVGGYQRIAHILSGDDVNLMQLMRHTGQRVRFANSHHAFASTRSVAGWRELLNQRARWASNFRWQATLNTEFFLYLCAVGLLQLGLVATLILQWRLGLAFVAAKLLAEWAFLVRSSKRFSFERERLRFFPVWFVLQVPYLWLVGALGQFNIFSWHGRR